MVAAAGDASAAMAATAAKKETERVIDATPNSLLVSNEA
jgi:threonine synthase